MTSLISLIQGYAGLLNDFIVAVESDLFLQIEITPNEFYHPSLTLRCANLMLYPFRYLFKGRCITLMKFSYQFEETRPPVEVYGFSSRLLHKEAGRTWYKTALMVILLIPTFFIGTLLKLWHGENNLSDITSLPHRQCHILQPHVFSYECPSGLYLWKPKLEMKGTPRVFYKMLSQNPSLDDDFKANLLTDCHDAGENHYKLVIDNSHSLNFSMLTSKIDDSVAADLTLLTKPNIFEEKNLNEYLDAATYLSIFTDFDPLSRNDLSAPVFN